MPEQTAKDEAASAMLGALKAIAEADRIGDWDEVTRHRFLIIGAVTAAIAQAEAAGIKAEDR
jgi:hypothetical protein